MTDEQRSQTNESHSARYFRNHRNIPPHIAELDHFALHRWAELQQEMKEQFMADFRARHIESGGRVLKSIYGKDSDYGKLIHFRTPEKLTPQQA